MQKLQEEVFINILRVKKTYYGYILNIHFKEMNEQMQENIIKAKRRHIPNIHINV